MAAYVIARVNVTDPEQYEEYKALTPAAVGAGGGRFIVRGGPVETLEGDEETRRVVVIEFDDVDQAKACIAGAQYQAARERRIGAAEMQMIVVDGA